MGNICKKSAFFKLTLQCFTAYLDLRNVWYYANVNARYKTKKIIITLCLTIQETESKRIYTKGYPNSMVVYRKETLWVCVNQ